jgi:hypothetical protein
LPTFVSRPLGCAKNVRRPKRELEKGNYSHTVHVLYFTLAYSLRATAQTKVWPPKFTSLSFVWMLSGDHAKLVHDVFGLRKRRKRSFWFPG